MSGLVFGCLDLYFGHLDMYSDVWTCIWGVNMSQPTTPWSMCLPQAHFFWKMTPLGFLKTYIVKLVDFHQFEGPLVKTSKYWQSVQMTMTARRASTFCAKRRAVLPEMFFQSPISRALDLLNLGQKM